MRSIILSCMLLATAPIAAATAIAAAAESPVPAGRYVMDRDHKKITWGVDHLGFSTFTGRFTRFDGTLTLDPAKPANSSVNVTIDMSSLASDNDKLDGELKGASWFDAAQFPTATFASTKVTMVDAKHAKVTGNLTLHGVTKPVTLDVTLHGAGMHPMMKVSTVGFDATGTIKRSDFGVATFLPMIGDDIALTISAEFQLAK
ncbi:YceI family protein [Novosphingobium sp. BL-52-GroH]|uniref:YceI family protein n=1 Tax=Novosphingobium sp. BL-52-GroH TaxID=3349877 RepID=UPI00384BC60F